MFINILLIALVVAATAVTVTVLVVDYKAAKKGKNSKFWEKR